MFILGKGLWFKHVVDADARLDLGDIDWRISFEHNTRPGTAEP